MNVAVAGIQSLAHREKPAVTLPIYAHFPYVAEPGGTAKLSKRKLDKYLKQKDFATLCQMGETIAERAHLKVTKETFNPVVVDFYRETGFLPGAIEWRQRVLYAADSPCRMGQAGRIETK